MVFLTIPQSVHAEEYASLSEKTILNMDSAKLLSTLQDRGLDLSRDYADNIDLAQRFVSEYTPLLIRREINPNVNIFNYDQSNEMLRNLAATLEKMNLPVIKSQNATTRYALQNSTAIGLWSDSYTNYNCYAYSVGRTWGLQPGTTQITLIITL